MLSVADLFCGAGGFSEGFRQLGFDIAFALDMWGPAIDTHKLNHPDCEHAQMDILELITPEQIDAVVPDVDVLIGSPPCVAFSGSNKAGKADKSIGIQLMEAYLRIVAWKLNKSDSVLKFWVLENVPNSESFIAKNYTFKELGLPGKGVALEVPTRKVLNAADHGAPQVRNRFFCGHYPVPERTNEEKDWVTFADVLDHLKDPLDKPEIKRIRDPNYALSIPIDELTDHFYDTTVEEFEWKNAWRQKRDHGYMGKMSFPEDTSRPSRTIMATRSGSTREAIILEGKRDEKGELDGYRMPTIREVSSIMSFPITYQYQGSSESVKYRLVGNAVCPMMARAIAQAILLDQGITPPSRLRFLGHIRPDVDLTGRLYVKRKPRPRKPNARFSRHIPELKKNGFRVELSNNGSDFKKDSVQWTCVLHTSVGKNAKWYKVDQDMVRKLFDTMFFKGFSDYEEDVKNSFEGRLPGPSHFQRIFCRLEESGKLGPEEALEEVRELIDRHFPPEPFEDRKIGNASAALGIEKNEVPLRILAGVYACNHIAKIVGSQD